MSMKAAVEGYKFITPHVEYNDKMTVNFGGKITGVPSLMQTYNVFANMTILK